MKTNSIINKIKTLIETNIPEAKAVYDVEVAELEKFPCVTIVPVSWENAEADLKGIRRRETFNLTVYGSLEETPSETQQVVRDLVDKICNLLESNITLDGEVEWGQPLAGRFDFIRRGVKIYFGQINYTVIYHYSRQ